MNVDVGISGKKETKQAGMWQSKEGYECKVQETITLLLDNVGMSDNVGKLIFTRTW